VVRRFVLSTFCYSRRDDILPVRVDIRRFVIRRFVFRHCVYFVYRSGNIQYNFEMNRPGIVNTRSETVFSFVYYRVSILVLKLSNYSTILIFGDI
jgi:hypothetical protein